MKCWNSFEIGDDGFQDVADLDLKIRKKVLAIKEVFRVTTDYIHLKNSRIILE